MQLNVLHRSSHNSLKKTKRYDSYNLTHYDYCLLFEQLNEMSMELERYRLVESSNSDPSSQAAVFTAKLKTK